MEEKQLRSFLSRGYIVDNDLIALKKLWELRKKNYDPLNSGVNYFNLATDYGCVVKYINKKLYDDHFEEEDKKAFPMMYGYELRQKIVRQSRFLTGYASDPSNGLIQGYTATNDRDYCIVFYGPIGSTSLYSNIQCTENSFNDRTSNHKTESIELLYVFLKQRNEKIVYTSEIPIGPYSYHAEMAITNKGSIIILYAGKKYKTSIFTNVSESNWDNFIVPDWFINISITPLSWWYKLIMPYLVNGHSLPNTGTYLNPISNYVQYPRYNGCVILKAMCHMMKNLSENTDKNTYPNTDILLPDDTYKQVIIYRDMNGMRLNYPQDPKYPTTERTLPSKLGGFETIYSKELGYVSHLFQHKTQISFQTWKETDEKIVWSYTSPVFNIPRSSSYNQQSVGGDFVGITNKGNVLFIQGNPGSDSAKYDIRLYIVVNDDMPIPEWFIESCVNPLFGICSDSLKPIEECESSNTPFTLPYCKIERRDHINILIAILCEMIRQYHLHFKKEGFTYSNASPHHKTRSYRNYFCICLMVLLGTFTISFIIYLLVRRNKKRKLVRK